MGAGVSSFGGASSHNTWSQRKFPEVRKPVRRVPMQVLCLGLPRTGTASLREALRYLGYGDVYHFTTVFNEQPGDAALWQLKLIDKFQDGALMNTRTESWDRLLGNCGAVTDIPCIIFAKELLATYPDAKVILTVRDDPKQWYESYNATVKPWFKRIYEHSNPTSFKEKMKAKLSWQSKPPIERMSELIQKHYLGPLEERGMEYYNEHNEMIKSLVAEDRLLVYNIKEGWSPLCYFLGKEPQKMEFPKLNEREGFPNMFAEAPPPTYSSQAGSSKQHARVDMRSTPLGQAPYTRNYQF